MEMNIIAGSQQNICQRVKAYIGTCYREANQLNQTINNIYQIRTTHKRIFSKMGMITYMQNGITEWTQSCETIRVIWK